MSNPVEVRAILDRVAVAIGARTDVEVAAALGVKAPTVANWQARGSVPYDVLCAFAAGRELTLDYLIFGLEPKHRRHTEIDPMLLALVFVAFDRAAKNHSRIGRGLAPGEKYFYAALVYNRLLRLPDERSRKNAAGDEVEFLFRVLASPDSDDVQRIMESTDEARRATQKK